jgi:hypothetical protein
MANESQKVRENYAIYCAFLDEWKTLEHEEIFLKEIEKRKNKTGSSQIFYLTLEGKKRFEAEISIQNQKHYRFKIFAEWFGGMPLFRFDSQGKAHCNPEEGTGLRARQVLTPHFQRYRGDGVEIAYHTPLLKKPETVEKIVGDYILGIEHFCQTAKLKCGQKSCPVLIMEQELMDLSSDDPLTGVSF